jgi:hypothetical protein
MKINFLILIFGMGIILNNTYLFAMNQNKFPEDSLKNSLEQLKQKLSKIMKAISGSKGQKKQFGKNVPLGSKTELPSKKVSPPSSPSQIKRRLFTTSIFFLLFYLSFSIFENEQQKKIANENIDEMFRKYHNEKKHKVKYFSKEEIEKRVNIFLEDSWIGCFNKDVYKKLFQLVPPDKCYVTKFSIDDCMNLFTMLGSEYDFHKEESKKGQRGFFHGKETFCEKIKSDAEYRKKHEDKFENMDRKKRNQKRNYDNTGYNKKHR